MANENDLDFMSSHFEAAGIKDDVNETSNGASTESGTSNDTTGNTGEESKVAGSDGKDNLGGSSDNLGEQGKKKEGEKPADTKTQQQQEQLPAGAIKLKDGTIVQPGAERRYFDQMNLARQQLHVTKNDLNTATQNLNNLKTKYDAVVDAVNKMGFDKPDDVAGAVRLYKDLQANPVEVVKKLLVELKQAGHNIDGIGSGVDTAAITALLDRKLGSSEISQRQQQEQVAAEVDQEVTNFIRDFPDAMIHEAWIGSIVENEAKQGRQISLRDAMFALKERVIQGGLDWSQPLAPQIEARKNGNQQQQQQQQQQKPRTNGRVDVGATEEISADKIITADNDSNDAIVRAAMREAGMKV